MKNCCQGIDALCADRTIDLLAQSAFYKTEPVDYTDQNWFINAAIYVRTHLTCLDLWEKAQNVQVQMGRKTDKVRFGPRVLDLDIIFYDDIILDSPNLVIPHPRMHKRRFVLQPICDIDPTIVHPLLGRSVQDLLNQLVIDGQDIRQCSSGC